MADQKITALTAVVTPDNTDLLPTVQDVGGTPVTKKITWTVVKAFLKTYFDTLYPSGSGTCSGTNTGDQTTVSGNAGTATTLQTSRNIDGQAFNGSADITVIAPGTHAASSKATPVDNDEVPLVDSAASNVLKRLTWANLKATLKSYFDTLYPSGSGSCSGTNTGDQTLPVKASGSEVDTGTDDAKFVTAKAINDSHNCPSVAPGTSGNIMSSNGTDWISSAPSTLPKFAVCSGDAITSQSLTDIAGMSIALTSGTWIFEILISGSAATGTAGAQFGVNYSGTTTSINAEQFGQLATTTLAATARITAFNTASTIVMTTSAAQCFVKIFGQVVVTGAGNLTAKGLKVTSQTLTINAASRMMAYKVA